MQYNTSATDDENQIPIWCADKIRFRSDVKNSINNNYNDIIHGIVYINAFIRLLSQTTVPAKTQYLN